MPTTDAAVHYLKDTVRATLEYLRGEQYHSFNLLRFTIYRL